MDDDFEFDAARAHRYVDIIEYTRIGMKKGVARCIARGDDVNQTDYSGGYAVEVAAQRNDMEILTMLVNAGARLDVYSGSPLGWAKHNKSEKMIDYIQEQLRDPKYQNKTSKYAEIKQKKQ